MNKKLIFIAAGIGIIFASFSGSLIVKKLRPELEKYIITMHPLVQNRFRNFINDVETQTGYRVEFASSHRGWADSVRIWQTYPQVQACCKPGQDYHFFGMAADLVLYGNGKRLGNNSLKSDWENSGVRQVARKHKMQWGIDFNGYFDPVHFALPLYNMTDLVNRAISVYGSLENAQGNRINTSGLKERTWQIA